MRLMVLVAFLGATLLTIAMLAPVASQGSAKPAQDTTALVVGIDVDPIGNTCPDNCTDPGGMGYCTTCPTAPDCDCSLGAVETCVEVSAGDVLQFDVFLAGLPSGEAIAGFSYGVSSFPGTLTTQTHDNGTVNLLAQPGSSMLDLGKVPPTAGPGPHVAAVADFGLLEYNPPFSKGVLGRYTLDVTGVSPGVYGLTLETLKVANEWAEDLCSLYGCEIWDANSTPQYYGAIAVDVPCGSAPPVITPTPTPSPTTPTATPTASPTPTPTPPGLVAGWNHTCYLGADLPTSQALADLGTNVLAIYRLRPDQGYDKWFPGRADVSDITTVRAYESLFILMADDVAWPQEPAVAPPADLYLAEGWNSACYSGHTKEVEAATTSIGGQYAVLYSLELNQRWRRFVPARPDVSNLAELQRFAAVLVLVSQPEGAHWIFDP